MDASIVVRLIDETRTGFSDINRNLSSVKSGLASVAAAFGSAFAVGTVTKIANEIETLNNKLKLVSGSSQEFAKNYQTVFNIAQRTGQPVNELGDLFAKLSRAQDTARISGSEVGKVTEVFANILRVSGVTASGAASAILQFSQAMQSGRLSGDEYRTILEQTPILLDMMAEKLGVTRAELRELSKDQKLSSEIVAKAMLLMGDEIDAMAGKMNTTLSQAFTKVQNALNDQVKTYMETSGVVNTVNKVLDHLASNMDNIFPIVQLVGVALAGVAAVLAGPVVVGFGAAVAVAIAFADEVGPLAKTVLSALGKALEFVVGHLMGFAAAVGAVLKGNFSGAMEEYDKALQGVKKTLDPTVKSQTELNQKQKEAEAQAKKLSPEYQKMEADLKAQVAALKTGSSEYAKFNQKLQEQIGLAGLDSDEKKRQQLVYDGLKAKAKDLQKGVEQLTAAEKAAVEQAVDGAIETIRAKEAESAAREKAYKDAVDLLKKFADESRKANQESLTEQQRYEADFKAINDAYNKARTSGKNLTAEELIEIESNYQDAIKGLQMKGIQELSREYKKYTDASKTDAQKFNDELLKIEQARQRAGVDGETAYQEAIAGLKAKYGQKFRDEAKRFRDDELTAEQQYTKRLEELNRAYYEQGAISQQDYLDLIRKADKDYREETIREYSNLYGVLNEKLLEWSGLSQKEYGIVKDVIKLTFGVDVEDLIKEFFAASIRYVLGFRTAATGDMNGIGGVISGLFGKGGTGLQEVGVFSSEGEGLISTFVSRSGDVLGGIVGILKNIFSGGLGIIGDFISSALGLFGDFGSSIGGFFSNIFSGIGGGGGGGGGFFDSILSFGGDLLGSIGGGIGDVFGGIGDFLGIGDIFSGIGDFGGDLLGSIGDLFGGGGGGSFLSSAGSALGSVGLVGTGLGLLESFGDIFFAPFLPDRNYNKKVTAQVQGQRSQLSSASQAKESATAGALEKFRINVMPGDILQITDKASGQMLFNRKVNRQGIKNAYPNLRDTQAYLAYASSGRTDLGAKGLAFNSGSVMKYALGGLIDRPTMFGTTSGIAIAGEAGTEAIMPLSRGRNGELGVNAEGMGDVSITFNITAVDAQGIDELLVERKQFITNMVRSAVADRGKIGRYF